MPLKGPLCFNEAEFRAVFHAEAFQGSHCRKRQTFSLISLCFEKITVEMGRKSEKLLEYYVFINADQSHT